MVSLVSPYIESFYNAKFAENSLRVGGSDILHSPALSFRYRKFLYPYSAPTLLASANSDGAYAVVFLFAEVFDKNVEHHPEIVMRLQTRYLFAVPYVGWLRFLLAVLFNDIG